MTQMSKNEIPICVRCAQRQAVACVRHPLGHRDAICVACVLAADVMLPLYWPGYEPSIDSISLNVKALYRSGNHEGAVVLLKANASRLGLDADQLHKMSTTDAALFGMRVLAGVS